MVVMIDERYDNALFRSLPQGEDLRFYVDEGRPMNHFLMALVSNDLLECVGRADPRNLAALEDYCMWLRSYAPPACFGDREKVAAWIQNRGVIGRTSAEGTKDQNRT